MSTDLANLIIETLSPLVVGATAVALLALRGSRAAGGTVAYGAAVREVLRGGALVTIVVAQLAVAGAAVYFARREGFSREVAARIVSVSTVMHRDQGEARDETVLWLATPDHGMQSVRFAGRVREACAREDVLRKPAWSWGYACAGTHADVEAAGTLRAVTLGGCALMVLFLVRLERIRRRGRALAPRA